MAPIPQCIIAQDLLGPSTFGALVAAVEYGALLVMSRWGPSNKVMLAIRVWIVVAATSAFALQIAWLALRPTLGSGLGDRLHLSLNVLYVLLNWTADSVIIWRTFMILSRSRIMLIPTICVHVCNIGAYMTAFAARTISLTLSMSMTLVMVIILWRAKRMASYASDGGSFYAQIIKTILLCAAIEAIPAISYIVCVGLSDSAQMFFLPILGQAQAVAPLLVSYRAARSWRTAASRSMRSTVKPPQWHQGKHPHDVLNIDLPCWSTFSSNFNFTNTRLDDLSPDDAVTTPMTSSEKDTEIFSGDSIESQDTCKGKRTTRRFTADLTIITYTLLSPLSTTLVDPSERAVKRDAGDQEAEFTLSVKQPAPELRGSPDHSRS
ncbi:hypothetical protein PENSPDRAFT_720437 [Peniophora sp. CONT]|nr:hypothetical protein PENSPDRAFT_720437 [Peniophora sp. CONT]